MKITLEELKDFEIWKQWKNGEAEMIYTEFPTKPGFVEKRTQQMINIWANEEYEQHSEGMSDEDIARWKHGFVCGANRLLNEIKNNKKTNQMTDSEKKNFIVNTELAMIKAMRNGQKMAEGDEFDKARKKIKEYREELKLFRPEQKV